MRRTICVFVGIIIAFTFVACSGPISDQSEDVEWSFSKKIAREICSDGWVYTFDYFYLKNGQDKDTLIPFVFNAINLRYRYNEDYTTTIEVIEDGEKVIKTVPNVIQILGESNSKPIKRDMEKIGDLLGYTGDPPSLDELLSLTSEDIEFEELDERIFLELLNKALSGDAHAEGNYSYLPTFALLTEPQYIDNYKFQIGFLCEIGCIDVIFIDVLFKTGTEYNDYVQLSDLFENNTASYEQQQAYRVIESISKGIVENNNLMHSFEDNHEKVIADIDFSRLFVFLSNIENGNYVQYSVMPE